MSKDTQNLFLINNDNMIDAENSYHPEEEDILEQMLEGIEEDRDLLSSNTFDYYVEPEIIEDCSLDGLISNVENSIQSLQKLSSEINYYNAEIYNQFHIE